VAAKVLLALIQARAWFNAVRGAGIPLVGQWEEMTASKYQNPEDAYVCFFVEASCQYGCELHTQHTPIKFRHSVRCALGEYSNLRVVIERAEKPRPYRIKWVSGSAPLAIRAGTTSGESWWNSAQDAIDFTDVVEHTVACFAPYLCEHLRPMLEISELVEALMRLCLLENSSV
jgi:hypothetical protein